MTQKPKYRLQVNNTAQIEELATGTKFLEASGEVLDKIAQTVNDFSNDILGKLVVSRPAKIKLEFGVNAGGKAGIPFVTEGSVAAHVKVAVEWELKA